jgi:hypothetical protein
VKESEVMEEKNNNEYNAEMAINEYLSLLQIKYDCETVYSLVKDFIISSPNLM